MGKLRKTFETVIKYSSSELGTNDNRRKSRGVFPSFENSLISNDTNGIVINDNVGSLMKINNRSDTYFSLDSSPADKSTYEIDLDSCKQKPFTSCFKKKRKST